MKRTWKLLLGALLLSALVSCVDTAPIEGRLNALSEKIAAQESAIARANDNAIAIGKFLRGKDILIVSWKALDHGYEMELSDGTTVRVCYGSETPALVPLIGVDADGYWILSLSGGKTYERIAGAAPLSDNDGHTPQVRINADGCWEISTDGKQWQVLLDGAGRPVSAVDGAAVAGVSSFFRNVVYQEDTSSMSFTLQDGRTVVVPVVQNFYLRLRGYKDGMTLHLGETVTYAVEASDVAEAIVRSPEGWTLVVTDSECAVTAPSSGTEGETVGMDILIVSSKGYLRKVKLSFRLTTAPDGKTGVKTWDDWVTGSDENVLLNYSYAGYDHGESAPADAMDLGYKVFNVVDYGAVPNDGKSDRAAVLKAWQAIIGEGQVQKSEARAILYFPEGEFILHTADDDVDGKSQPLQLRGGYFVIKGAGRDKTTLVMDAANQPASEALYSSPVMLEIKHNSGLSKLAEITSDAPKGSFSVEVSTSAGIAAGDWVCLHVINNNAAFVAQELAPYSVEATMTNIIETGVQVYDYHQVKSVSGTTVTFVEPIMHAVEARWGWTLQKYPHYEQVGVEDLTFKGKAKENFKHHGSWEDDGAYKPLSMVRIANGWLRRVRFTSVSEACTISHSANISVYDIEIDGNRGHSSIRSQTGSRVFIGKVWDHSSGALVSSGVWAENTGQYHAVGVSKPSIGTVLWRNTWGRDGCFEAHATQPRATLIDCCEGGWMQMRQGGDENQVPNHLSDLVIWNFRSTTPFSGTWDWWKTSSKWWKILPPVVVGFHGEVCDFLASQTRVDESHGTAVEPESLYEAQLKKRLGAVPAWLNAIK